MPSKVKVNSLRINTKVVDALESGLRGELHQPQMANVAGHFLQMVGGERAFAKILLDEYRSEKSTPTMKARIMQMILGAMRFANERQNGIGDDLGLMNDEDLAKTLERTILSISGNQEASDGVEPQQREGETPTAAV